MPHSLPIEEQHPLAPHTTLGIGGPARYFTEVKTAEQMADAFQFARHGDLPVFVLGKGSNCLFDDRGFNGLVILNKIDFMRHNEPNLFTAGSGYSFSRLGSYTARHGWTGLEFASGIPASVGGAVYMNAGANGQDTSQTLLSVDFLSVEGQRCSLLRSDLSFSYRSSPFQKRAGAILSATFVLTPHPEAKAQQLSLLDYRKATQPYGELSAGCFFTNPSDNSAGRLIDSIGLKGLSIGGAQVSPMHANFIVNTGKATAQDILKLAELIKEKVRQECGYELEQEVRFVPYLPR